jgi:hypothetical protein
MRLRCRLSSAPLPFHDTRKSSLRSLRCVSTKISAPLRSVFSTRQRLLFSSKNIHPSLFDSSPKVF